MILIRYWLSTHELKSVEIEIGFSVNALQR